MARKDEKINNVYLFFKRIIDITIALLGIVLMLPLFLIISLLIKIESKGDIFFKQKRLGYKGKVFTLYKFRSMVKNAEKMGPGIFNFEDDPRVTRIGRFLRKYSLDELPQLFNVLKGEMSIVGPRPPVTYELGSFDNFSEELKRRFLVKPGLTGYAQINGRNKLSWDEKIKYDLMYINDFKEYGILVDLKVILITIYKVVKGEGIFEDPIKAKKDMKRIGGTNEIDL